MVERLDRDDPFSPEPPGAENAESRASLGLDGIQIELQDFKDTKHPGSVAEGEADNVVMFGKIGNKDVARKLNVTAQGRQWNRSTSAKAPSGGSFIKWCPLLNPKHLSPFFDVTTSDIVERLMHSLVPFSPKFHQIYHSKPDLYAPFWILTSLIAMLFIAGNLSRYLKLEDKDKFEYNFSVIPVASGIIYGFGVGLPVVVHSSQRWFGTNTRPQTPLASAIGIYGYSFSSFLVVSILCAIPVNWLQWLLVTYAAVTSLGLLSRTYWQEFQDNLEPNHRWIGIALICLVQLVLLLIFKVYFFKTV